MAPGRCAGAERRRGDQGPHPGQAQVPRPEPGHLRRIHAGRTTTSLLEYR